MNNEVELSITSASIGEIKAQIVVKNPETADAIVTALPLEGPANVWGEEIYFEIPVTADEEDSQQEMEIGDIAFWPMGNAMCFFFGPTPVSGGETPMAYSPVNLFAKIKGDAKILKNVKDGEIVKVERL
jgi:hypothetical protein